MSDTYNSKHEALQQEVSAQAKDLLQEQLTYLSARLFEVGKKADQQLTTWMVFAALCPLVLFGAFDSTSVGGVKLDPLLAGATIYIVSCVFYYRAILSISALEHWRSFLKQHRRERFAGRQIEQLADSVFDGQLAPILLSLVDRVRLNKKDREAIERILRKLK